MTLGLQLFRNLKNEYKSLPMKKIVLIFCLVLFANTVFAQKTHSIAFYNVENLFDTLDGPNDDAEFLPNSKNEWNTIKYEEKLTHIREVLLAMGKPFICGFSEVENAGVVRAIIAQQKDFKNFGLVHFESPDARGIDVAMIYDSSRLKVLASNHIRFILPGETKATTRDILWAQFKFKKQVFYVMVNHWPSRRGGTDESDAKRVAAAQVACRFIDSVQKANGLPIVLLGDLNDYPDNTGPKLLDERLDPMITVDSGPTKGTHCYNNEWGILDHIYVSPNFIGSKKGILKNSGVIHHFPFLMEEYKGVLQPKRTYGGSKYLGGYSDHLPVSVKIK
jgi:predicted extracellular nuclease